jgi:hypothetical protein
LLPSKPLTIYGLFFYLTKDVPMIKSFSPVILYRKLKNGGIITGEGFLKHTNPIVKLIEKKLLFTTQDSREFFANTTVVDDNHINFIYDQIPTNVTSVSLSISFDSGFYFHEIQSTVQISGISNL